MQNTLRLSEMLGSSLRLQRHSTIISKDEAIDSHGCIRPDKGSVIGALQHLTLTRPVWVCLCPTSLLKMPPPITGHLEWPQRLSSACQSFTNNNPEGQRNWNGLDNPKKRREGEEERYDNSKVSKKNNSGSEQSKYKKKEKNRKTYSGLLTQWHHLTKRNEQRKKRLGRGRQRKTKKHGKYSCLLFLLSTWMSFHFKAYLLDWPTSALALQQNYSLFAPHRGSYAHTWLTTTECEETTELALCRRHLSTRLSRYPLRLACESTSFSLHLL